MAFLSAGGVRGDFAREWAFRFFLGEARSAYTPAAAGG
jgi:hypothetical protein